MFKTFNKDLNKRVWRLPFILLAELIGTFAMVFWIVAPSALNLSETTVWYNTYFANSFAMQALWVAGFVLILIVLLRAISVNLNPAVTLAEVATGKNTWQQAFWMIGAQFVAGFAAVYFGYFLATHISVVADATGGFTWSFDSSLAIDSSIWAGSQKSLNAIYPVLQTSGNEMEWFGWEASYADAIAGTFSLWEAGWTANSTALAFMLIPFAIEFVFTLMLISSVVYTSENKHVKTILIFLTLMFVITLGMHTNNTALNPVRLMAPSFITAVVTGNTAFVAYTFVFLAGEALAVLVIFRKEARRAVKEGTTMAAVRREVTEIMEDVAILRGKYKWVVDGNKAFDKMTEAELNKAIADHNAEEHVIKKGSQKQRTNSFVKFLVFGPEKTAPKKISKKQKAKADAIAAKKGVKQIEPKEEVKAKEAKPSKKDSKKASKKDSKKESKKETK